MSKRLLLCAVLIGLLCPGVILAQDVGVPDTIYYGDQGEAYAVAGDQFYVPVYVVNDETIVGLDFVMEYGAGAIFPTWDSISTFGTDMMNSGYFDLAFPLVSTNSIDGFPTDTLAIAGVAIDDYLPPGRIHLCNVWFHGAGVGDVLPFDTVSHNIVGHAASMAPQSGNQFLPQMVAGELTLTESPTFILPVLPDNVSGDAASLISFQVSAEALYLPVVIRFDSLISAETGLPAAHIPTTSGSNPLTVEWTPQYEESGTWQAWFTGTDAESSELAFSVPIAVNWVPTPCDVLRGDTDCDGIVNISDVVYLVNYIFGQGTPPGCKK